MQRKETNTPFLARITIYPIKALDGVTVSTARISPSGALTHDRTFAMVDQQGRFVNGKHNAQVHLLRSVFDLDRQTVTLQVQGTEDQQCFHLDHDRHALEGWLSHFFGFPVTLWQNTHSGFPDDTDASGPTVISTPTLAEVSTWFPGLSVEEMRTRFRANLEIDGVPAFWEDRLFDAPGTVIGFAIGEAHFAGVNPCQRCVVPTRDPHTAAVYPLFTKIFATKRAETLPSWAASSRFDHFYRLSVNTRIAASETNKVLKVGDMVRVLGMRHHDNTYCY